MMDFGYFVSMIKNEMHPYPTELEKEARLLLDIMQKGQGYLTKRTETEPYCRVIFFDSDAVK